jgi:hypothetical protein
MISQGTFYNYFSFLSVHTVFENPILLFERFPCHNHKLDNAIKKAIASHSLANMMRRLTKANAHFRRCVRLSDVFAEKKCRQRCESATRWSWVTFFVKSLSYRSVRKYSVFYYLNIFI